MGNDVKLHFLYQYTTGVARKLVETCLYMPPAEGYKRAWNMLERKFGNTEVLCSGYIDKLLNTDGISRDDPDALDSFAVNMMMTHNALSTLSYGQAELDNPKTIRALVEKLPYNLQDGWRRLATDVAISGERQVRFKDLMDFVEREAKIANNPLFGKELWASGKAIIKPSRVDINDWS